VRLTRKVVTTFGYQAYICLCRYAARYNYGAWQLVCAFICGAACRKTNSWYQEAAAATQKLTADSSSFVPVAEPSVVVDKMQSVSFFLLCVVPLVVRWLLLLWCVCLCVMVVVVFLIIAIVIALMMLPPYTLVSGPGEH
jgi:hypothetical protein